jgi:hypothetical protein
MGEKVRNIGEDPKLIFEVPEPSVDQWLVYSKYLASSHKADSYSWINAILSSIV